MHTYRRLNLATQRKTMTAFENLKGKTIDYVILFSEMMAAVLAVKSTPRLLIVVQINHVSMHKVYI